MVATAFWFALGVGIGVALVCLCRSAKVVDLQKQVDEGKPDCEGCDYYRRMLAAEDQLQEAKDDRMKLYRSNMALRRDNKHLYSKVWRDA